MRSWSASSFNCASGSSCICRSTIHSWPTPRSNCSMRRADASRSLLSRWHQSPRRSLSPAITLEWRRSTATSPLRTPSHSSVSCLNRVSACSSLPHSRPRCARVASSSPGNGVVSVALVAACALSSASACASPVFASAPCAASSRGCSSAPVDPVFMLRLSKWIHLAVSQAIRRRWQARELVVEGRKATPRRHDGCLRSRCQAQREQLRGIVSRDAESRSR